jgi:CubicO group peptidase (beta-lactamase class C family)
VRSEALIEDALEQALKLGEVGVQVAAYLDGELIVDAYVGVADDESDRPVEAGTLFPVFSMTKGLISTAIHLQAERGLLDVDTPVADYWPEYAARGKSEILIRHVMSHTAGVPHMPPHLTLEGLHDWDAIVSWLAEVQPLHAPGERSIYHSISFGYILGEVLRRTDPKGRLFSQYLREELCAPIGVEDLWVGLPPEEEARVARLTWGGDPPSEPFVAPGPMRSIGSPPSLAAQPEVWNLPIVHQACIPAGGAIMTARAGARFFALLASGGELDGRRLLSRERLLRQTAYRPDPMVVDDMWGLVCTLGVGGYWLSGYGMPSPAPGSKLREMLAVDQGPHVLVNNGSGGSSAWANLDTGLSVTITHNRLFGPLPRDRHPFVPIGNAVRRIAGYAPKD